MGDGIYHLPNNIKTPLEYNCPHTYNLPQALRCKLTKLGLYHQRQKHGNAHIAGGGGGGQIVKNLLIHIGIIHQEERLDIERPYCSSAFHDLGNLNTHIQKTSPDKTREINNEMRAEFEEGNREMDHDGGVTGEIKNADDHFAQMETFYGRIIMREEDVCVGDGIWRRTQRPFVRARKESIG